MGQVASSQVNKVEEIKAAESSVEKDAQQPSSMEDLIAEATAYGGIDENESLDAKAQKALECPCIADLRNGACGSQFSEAFVCFIKSTAEEKGSECVNPFIALQNCIKKNPGAFSKDVLDGDLNEEAVQSQEYKINPPEWAKEQSSKL